MENNWFIIKNQLLDNVDYEVVIKELIPLLKKTNPTGKYHPLGFYSFHLCKFNENENLRLHIWKDKSSVQSNELLIHNHIFNFKSLVLIGEIKNHKYQLIKQKQASGCLYVVNYLNESSTLRKINNGFELLDEKVEIIEKGQYYQSYFSEFHKSTSEGKEMCATLLLTHNVSKEKPLVFSVNDLGDEIVYQRDMLDISTQTKVLNDLLEELIKVKL